MIRRAHQGLAMLATMVALLIAHACNAQPPERGFLLGVQTHFSQNWPTAWLDRALDVRAGSLRDSLPWGAGEQAPGRYTLTGRAAGPLTAFCKRSAVGDVLLTLNPTNPLYDGGKTVHSATAMGAYAAYLNAVLDRFPGCVTAIEVGNEINAWPNIGYPDGVDGAAAYVALLRLVRAQVKPRHPDVAILGGSTNVIGTGFLETLFKAGMLDAADGVVVHPYRRLGDNIDWELAHLDTTMRKYGSPLPVWATEFSDNYATPDLAAPQLVKAVTLMRASGVHRAYWYALVDQRFFLNMGLYDNGLRAKPAAEAFLLMQNRLLPAGKAERVGTSDPNVRLYRFGADRWVAWGPSGTLRFEGGSLLDARGRPMAGTAAALGPDPVIVIGATHVVLEPGPVIADSMAGFGGAPWSYLVRAGDGRMTPLGILDSHWTSAYGSRFHRPLAIGDISGAVAGTGANPSRAVIRYTAPAEMDVTIGLCMGKAPGGDGLDVAVAVNGKAAEGGILTRDWSVSGLDLALARGDTVDLIVGPNQVPGNDSFRYRMRIMARGKQGAVPCP